MYDFSKINLRETKIEIEEKLSEHSDWELFNRIPAAQEAHALCVFLKHEFPEFDFESRSGQLGYLVFVSK